MPDLNPNWQPEDESHPIAHGLTAKGLMYKGKWLISPERQEKTVRIFWVSHVLEARFALSSFVSLEWSVMYMHSEPLCARFNTPSMFRLPLFELFHSDHRKLRQACDFSSRDCHSAWTFGSLSSHTHLSLLDCEHHDCKESTLCIRPLCLGVSRLRLRSLEESSTASSSLRMPTMFGDRPHLNNTTRKTLLTLRIQRILLKNAYMPLIFRVTVLAFSIAALAISAAIFIQVKHVNADDNPNNQCATRASTFMGLSVGSVAVPYIAYVTWDEYMSKP